MPLRFPDGSATCFGRVAQICQVLSNPTKDHLNGSKSKTADVLDFVSNASLPASSFEGYGFVNCVSPDHAADRGNKSPQVPFPCMSRICSAVLLSEVLKESNNPLNPKH